MKTCHICEHIVKSNRAVSCLTCKRTFCYPCISQFFPETFEQYVPKTSAETIKQSKTQQCHYCLKLCKCNKCTTSEAIIVTLNVSATNQEELKTFVLGDEETSSISPLFQGKKLSELPDYLQRIYAKKKVIYTTHQLSVLKHQNVPPEGPQEHQEQSENKEIQKARDEMQNLQQGGFDRAKQIQEANSGQNKMEVENNNDQGNEEQSEEASESRNASAELFSQKIEAENEENEQNSSEGQMVDENEENGSEHNADEEDQNPQGQPGSSQAFAANASSLRQPEIHIDTSNRERGRDQGEGEKKQE